MLWTNPSPTSTFNAQTISIPNIYDFKAIVIENYFISDIEQHRVIHSNYFINRTNVTFVCLSHAISGTQTNPRSVKFTNSGIEFGNGYNNSNASNTCCVPVNVYGIK